ncbi:MAG: tetratricopeptide repeat protein, partial [Deltaproteobacteria bacterium]|nr:tetratricopeptide repeat protein [Deltaproteobacteria bacterium]
LHPAAENADPKIKKGLIREKIREAGGSGILPVTPEEGKRPKESARGAATADINDAKKTDQAGEQQDLVRQIGMVFEKGDHREVLRLFGLHREALLKGADPRLLQQVGNSYKALGFYDPAVRTFQAAWQGGAQGSPALVLDWAEALAGKGKVAEAVSLIQTLLERPLESREQQEKAVRMLVRYLYRQRLYPEALKTLETAGRRFPRWDQDPENRYLLGIICFEIPGMGPKSLTALRQFVAVSQDPLKMAAAYEKIGDLYFDNKQYQEAWRVYYQAGRLQPESKGTFLAKKLTQCRLLAEERPSGAAGNGVAETDPFWKKLSEHRSDQRKLDKQVNELRLN